MSDYESMYQDYLLEMALEKLHNDAVMRAAALAQCIYLFVEGDSEEKAFPILLTKTGINFEELGVVIANYNGAGNFLHSLRLMLKTLSHDRPIIATIDNDMEGQQLIEKYNKLSFKTEKISIFPIPQEAKVTYKNGYKGGSFEEIFPVDHFLKCCFSNKIMSTTLVDRQSEFKSSFNPEKPWYDQVKYFCVQNCYSNFAYKKTDLAEQLAIECTPIPKDILDLAKLIKEIRKGNPIKNPNDIELPKIPGLTLAESQSS